ncbi:MAG: hypothetical protein KGL39_17545 [Patescibacteria group bacterium]|nr:hypothetical protein [Patescibacteria group bacterium]
MAAIVGKGGAVKVGANTVAELDEWTLDIDADTLDDTSFGSDWKTYLQGLKSWTGSLKGRWDVATDTNGQAALQAALLGGTSITLALDVDSTTPHGYTGTAFVKKLAIGANIKDLITFQCDFEGSGALTYA